MRVTLEQYDVVYSAETDRDDLTLTEAVNDLVRPVLLAAGYSEKLVDDAVPAQ